MSMLVVGLMGICEDEFVQCFILVNQYREFCALSVQGTYADAPKKLYVLS